MFSADKGLWHSFSLKITGRLADRYTWRERGRECLRKSGARYDVLKTKFKAITHCQISNI